jgi:pimeloyl-ACP methyl ester carboxylesterase
MATFVDDTLALLDALGVERAHVYGQSFGGMVAQELALTHAEFVRTLILACTHAGPPHVLRGKRSHVPKGEPWRSMYAPDFPDRHPDHVAEDLRVGAAQPKHPEGGRRQWEAMQGFDSFYRLPNLRVPTLVVHGSEDQAIAPENAELLAGRIPGAELLLLEGAGHLYHSEQADRADAAVLDFIRRHDDA